MHRRGLTLLEVLIALSILSFVMLLTFSGVFSSLNFNSAQNATVSAQTRLRRVSEVVNQEIRGAVFGALIDFPYVNDGTNLSLFLVDQGLGYPVLSGGSTSGFPTRTSTRIVDVGNVANFAAGEEILLLSPFDGSAHVMPVSSVQRSGQRTDIIHAGCQNTVTYNNQNPPLLFRVRRVGLSYDAANNKLVQQERGQIRDFAYDISAFAVSYIYTNATTGAQTTVATPVRQGGTVAKRYTSGPDELILSAISLTISTQEQGTFNRLVTRTYTTEIPLSDVSDNLLGTAASFGGVTVCP